MAQSLYEKNGYVKDDKFSIYSRDLQLWAFVRDPMLSLQLSLQSK
jgi:hypothetical protein